MNLIDDVVRWAAKLIEDMGLSGFVHDMGLEAFRHVVEKYLPSIWDRCKEYASEIFDFITKSIFDT